MTRLKSWVTRGIRISRSILEQCGLKRRAELRVENGTLVIAAEYRARAGWEEAFRAAAPAHDERLLGSVSGNDFDREEWKW